MHDFALSSNKLGYSTSTAFVGCFIRRKSGLEVVACTLHARTKIRPQQYKDTLNGRFNEIEAIPLVHRKNRTWCCGPRAYLSDEELEQDGVAQRSVVDTYRLDHGRVCQVRQIVLCVVNVRINNCTAHKRVQG